MNGQYLCGKAITVNYAMKKDGKGGEKHGTAAGKFYIFSSSIHLYVERLIAAQAKKNKVEIPV